MIYVIIAVLTLALPAFGVGPIIRRGGTYARNNQLAVLLPPDSATLSQGQSPAGRRAQEVTDWVHRWAVALLIASPVLLLPNDYLSQLIALLLIFSATFWSEIFETHFDLVGHGAEIIVAEREGRKGYRAAEIERMRQYSPAFKGWTAGRIDASLRKREWLSRIFVKVLA